MQIGFYLAGTKLEVLSKIKEVGEREKRRVKKEREEYKVHRSQDIARAQEFEELGGVYNMTGLKYNEKGHRSVMLNNEYTNSVIDEAISSCIESLVDLENDEQCSVAFQITVQRRNVF